MTQTYLHRAIYFTLTRKWPKRAWTTHFFDIGNRTLVLVCVCMGFFGMMMVEHADFQARRIIGDISRVGPMFFQLMVREFGPTMAALLVAARAGSSIAAEIASMKVTEQVDALHISGIDEVAELVAPRIAAGTVATFALSVLGTAASVFAAALYATYQYGADGSTFYDPQFTRPIDLISGSLKAIIDGAFIPFIAGWAGLRAARGSQSVGQAVTDAVLTNALVVMSVDLIIGLLFGHGLRRRAGATV